MLINLKFLKNFLFSFQKITMSKKSGKTRFFGKNADFNFIFKIMSNIAIKTKMFVIRYVIIVMRTILNFKLLKN